MRLFLRKYCKNLNIYTVWIIAAMRARIGIYFASFSGGGKQL